MEWIELSKQRPESGMVVWRDPAGVMWITDWMGRGGLLPDRVHESPTHWVQLITRFPMINCD